MTTTDANANATAVPTIASANTAIEGVSTAITMSPSVHRT